MAQPPSAISQLKNKSAGNESYVFFYREAIALAKVRLLPSDPLLVDLYSSWGRRLENELSFEQASKW